MEDKCNLTKMRESKYCIIMIILTITSLFANRYLINGNFPSYTDSSRSNFKEQGKIYQSLPSSCERNVKLGKNGQFKITLLASFPGSGNTWSRLLIENASGYYTGSVFNETRLCK